MQLTTTLHPAEVITKITWRQLRGARVLFINMPIRGQAEPNNPPLGIAQLFSCLWKYHIVVNAIDLNAYRKREGEGIRCLNESEVEELFENFLKKNETPDLIAMSGLITTLAWQEKVARMVKKMCPSAILATGGGLATEFGETLFSWIPELNAVAVGEGDEVIVKMVYDALKIRQMGLAAATSAGHLQPYLVAHVKGEPLFLYRGARPIDLNALPTPSFNLLAEYMETYISNPVWGSGARNSSDTPFQSRRSLSMISSRGCPFSCKFCYRPHGQRNYGILPAYRIAAEMLILWAKYNLDFIGIIDDNFMVSRSRINELFLELERNSIAWGTHGRLDEAADIGRQTGRIETMAKAGCKYIGFGAESASEQVIKRMGKGGQILSHGFVEIDGYRFPKTMIDGIKRTHAAGVYGNCTWIMGYPGETLQDLKTSVAFQAWQGDFVSMPVNRQMFTATAYPGTEMFKEPLVQQRLQEIFGIEFNGKGDPIPNQALKNYVLELEDASKMLRRGRVLNYSDMPDDVFQQVREYIDSGSTGKILEML